MRLLKDFSVHKFVQCNNITDTQTGYTAKSISGEYADLPTVGPIIVELGVIIRARTHRSRSLSHQHELPNCVIVGTTMPWRGTRRGHAQQQQRRCCFRCRTLNGNFWDLSGKSFIHRWKRHLWTRSHGRMEGLYFNTHMWAWRRTCSFTWFTELCNFPLPIT